MTAQLRRTRIDYGHTAVYEEKHKPGKGTEGYIRNSRYVTTPTDVWAVVDVSQGHDPNRHKTHFRQGAHAVSWLLTITQKGDTLDDTTWREIHATAPGTLPAFRKITGQDWQPEAQQAGLFAEELMR